MWLATVVALGSEIRKTLNDATHLTRNHSARYHVTCLRYDLLCSEQPQLPRKFQYFHFVHLEKIRKSITFICSYRIPPQRRAVLRRSLPWSALLSLTTRKLWMAQPGKLLHAKNLINLIRALPFHQLRPSEAQTMSPQPAKPNGWCTCCSQPCSMFSSRAAAGQAARLHVSSCSLTTIILKNFRLQKERHA